MEYKKLQELHSTFEEAVNLRQYEDVEYLINEILLSPSNLSHTSDNNEFSSELIYTQEELQIRSSALRLFSHALVQQGKANEALTIAEQALAEAKKIHDRGGKTEEARIYSTLGIISRNLSKYHSALDFYAKSLVLNEELGLELDMARVLSNIGNVYADISEYNLSLENYFKALTIHEKLNDTIGVVIVCSNIGLVYKNLFDKDRALEYLTKSLFMYEELGNQSGVARTMGNIGNVYEFSSEYSQALEYMLTALSMHEQLNENLDVARVIGNIGCVYNNISEYGLALEYLFKALSLHETYNNRDSLAIVLGHIGDLYAVKEFEGYDVAKAEEYLLKAYALSEELETKHHLYTICLSLAELYENTNQWEKFAVFYKKYHALKEEVMDEETKQQAEKFAVERKEAEREKALAIERALAKATKDILSDIFPPTITERLIKGEKKIADSHESVSVLFVDIVGFTKLSTKLPAVELIDLLDILFTRFDVICKKHGLEKIKTIGDAYMAVCGAPIAYTNHAERAAHTALEMLEKFSIEQEFSVPIDLNFRIGLHTGSVVAGIIGENKFAYDLWGDAVNTASRMESHGEAGKIHVSEEFRNSAGNTFTFIERGEMEIKGKGMMKTYFLENV